MVTETSLQAYESLKPKLGYKQMIVYEMLSHFSDMTNHELSKKLGWEINSVTPRINELRVKKYVEPAGKRVCAITGNTVNSWRVAPRHQQELF